MLGQELEALLLEGSHRAQVVGCLIGNQGSFVGRDGEGNALRRDVIRREGRGEEVRVGRSAQQDGLDIRRLLVVIQ